MLTGAQLFSLNKEELRAVIPEEGARVYSQLTVQKALLEVKQRFLHLHNFLLRRKEHDTIQNVSESIYRIFGNSLIFSSFQDARRATELEEVMEKQKMKVDLKLESSTL